MGRDVGGLGMKKRATFEGRKGNGRNQNTATRDDDTVYGTDRGLVEEFSREAGDWEDGDRVEKTRGGRVFLGEDEKRILVGLCEKCGSDEHVGQCLVKTLRCNYPPCTNPDGHVTSVCRELMKRCRMPICDDARGHRAKCHFIGLPDGTGRIGTGIEGANFLKTIFEMYKRHLTDEEVKVIEKYEGENN